MSACSTATGNFMDVVETLLAVNPEKYRHFDNAAAFLLSASSLTAEQKAQTLAHLGRIYDQLNQLQPNRYPAGQLTSARQAEARFETGDYQGYLDLLGQILVVPKRGQDGVSADQVREFIENMDPEDLSAADVSQALEALQGYLALQPALDTPQLRLAAAEPYLTGIQNQLERQPTPDPMLQHLLDIEREDLQAFQTYVPLERVLLGNTQGIPSSIGVRLDGTRVELNSHLGEFGNVDYTYAETNLPAPLSDFKYPPRVDYPVSKVLDNKGQQVFFANDLGAALAVRALNSADQDRLDGELKNLDGESINSQIQVKALVLEDFTDSRLERLHERARQDDALAGLLNRQHETFENSVQQARLAEGGQQVLTVRRPTKSQDRFQLVATLPSGLEVILYSPRNYTVVSSDNTTRALDLTKEEDQQLVRELSVVRHPTVGRNTLDAPMSAQQAAGLGEAVRLFDEFATQVQQLLDVPGAPTAQDVTNLFRQNYVFSAAKREKTRVPLDEFITQKGNDITKSLTVVKMTAGTAVEGSGQTRQLPISFVRYGDHGFQPIAALAAGEMIQHEGNYYSYADYVEQVLGLTHEVLVRDYVKPEHYDYTWGLSVYFTKDVVEPYKYMSLEPRRPLENVAGFAHFISLLDETRTKRNSNDGWKAFGQENYAFRLNKSGMTLNFNALDRGKDKGNVTLELRGTNFGSGLSTRLNKGRINFILPQKRFDALTAQLRAPASDPTLISDLLVRFELLKSLTPAAESTPDQLQAFYQTAADQLTDRRDPLAKRMQAVALAWETEFSTILKESVFDQFENVVRNERTADLVPGLADEVMRAFKTDKAGVNESYLLAMEYLPGTPATADPSTRTYVPKLTFGSNNPAVRTMGQYWVKTAPPKEGLRVLPASSAHAPMPTVARQVESRVETPATAPVAAAETPTTPVVSPQQADVPVGRRRAQQGKGIMSLQDSIQNPVSEAAQAFQIGNVRTWLPQFQISEMDVSDVLDLDRYDGRVSGLFMNRVTYLNRKLSESGTVYHEAFHGVFRHLLTAMRREELVDNVAGDKRYKALFTEGALREFARKRNLVYNPSTTRARQAEEVLADGFRDFALTGKKAARTLWQQFFDFLQRLLKLGTHRQQQLDALYGDITAGSYSKAVVQENDDLFRDEPALQLLDGLEEVAISVSNGEVVDAYTHLGVDEQNELINKLVHDIVFDDAPLTFDQRFEKHRRNLYHTRYNPEFWKKTPGLSEERKLLIDQVHGKSLRTSQYLLGMAADGLPMTKYNSTNNPEFDRELLYNDEAALGKQQQTLAQFKEMVKHVYDGFVLRQYFEEDALTNPEKLGLLAVDNGAKLETEDEQNSREENKEADFDEANNEQNPYDTIPNVIRQYFGLLEYELPDPRTGVPFTRMVNGYQLFNTLIRVTANVQPEQLISRIKRLQVQYDEDGDLQAARSIEAVYEKLVRLTGMDRATNLPSKNHQLYHQFIEAFHLAEQEFLVNTVSTKQGKTIQGIPGKWSSSSYIKDAVLANDLLQKKITLTGKFQERYNQFLAQPAGGDAEYEKALETAYRVFQRVRASSATKPNLSGRIEERLNALTDELTLVLKTIGMQVPRSLVRLSLLAIDREENLVGVALGANTSAQQHYDENVEFAQKGQYLQKDFFTNMEVLVRKMKERVSAAEVAELLNSESDNEASKRFNAILTKAAYYLAKYDPKDTVSTVKNGEGKPVYRYVKYTPSITISQSIRQNPRGLVGELEQDPYFQSHLKDFFRDNPWLQLAMEPDNNSDEAVRARLFFANFKVAGWGAIRQNVDEQSREGVSYKNADDKGLQIDYLSHFLRRQVLTKKVVDEKGQEKTVSLTTYNRTLTQFEASGTNYLVSGRYRAHIDATGKPVTYHGQPLVVESFEHVIKQEFNRIRREYSTRNQSKNLLIDYNAKGSVQNPDVENLGLRAYNFQVTEHLMPKSDTLTQELLREARTGQKSFEDVMASGLGEELRKKLGLYAEREFNEHLNSLVTNGVLTRTSKPNILYKNGVGVRAPFGTDQPTSSRAFEGFPEGELYLVDPNMPVVEVFSSRFLPTSVSEDYGSGAPKSKSISDVYGPDNNGSNLEAMVWDAYFNFLENSLLVNQVFDGDVALTVSGAVNYFKRNKAHLAAGSTMKRGLHSVGMMSKLLVLVDPQNLEAGQYDSKEAFLQAVIDAQTSGDMERYAMLLESYNRVMDLLESGDEKKAKSVWTDVFDGQSISLHMHQIDMYQSLGRLGQGKLRGNVVSHLDLLIAKQYRSLDSDEIDFLENAGIVHNSKKTVTTSRLQYHKLSEHLLDRGDISYLKTELLPGERGYEDEVAEKHQELDRLYRQIYQLRQGRNQLHVDAMRDELANPDPSTIHGSTEALTSIQELYRTVHGYFAPLRGRERLHQLLGSMELHQIDQLMDHNASKKLSQLPLSIPEFSIASGYLPLDLSRSYVDNRFKYLQVETSGVHDEVKAGVQAKVLKPADMQQIANLVLLDPNATTAERKAALGIAETLGQYQHSLNALTSSKFELFKQFMRGEDGNFNVGEVFQLIHQSLQEQGADSNKLKWFELDEAGQPKHGTNMPQVRKMLEYYFFSVYSNNVTDEKVAGFKSFHATSYGYKLVFERATGKLVPMSEVKRNPGRYQNDKLYGTRYPGVKKETNAKGENFYRVEVLMPRPAFKNKAHEKFWRENVSQMFGTRIPTEDKRSMMVLEVVDFIDESYRNTVIVPQLIHLLSGSDLDIDSLYGQMFNTYREWIRPATQFDDQGRRILPDGNGSGFRKYGDYTNLTEKGKQVRRFTELLTYVGGRAELKSRIAELQTERQPGDGFLEETRDLFYLLGYEYDQLDEADQLDAVGYDNLELLQTGVSAQEMALEDRFLDQYKKQLRDSGYSESEVAFVTDDLDTEYGLQVWQNQELLKVRYQYHQALAKIQRQQLAARLDATLRTLKEVTKLPTSLPEFVALGEAGSHLITPVHQNENLQDSIDLLSNEMTFRRLYINEQQSSARFKEIIDTLGVSVEGIATQFNPYSIDGVLRARGINVMNKTGIALTANLNKFLAIASQYELELHDKSTLWRIATKLAAVNEDGSPKLDENGQQELVEKLRIFNQFGGFDERGVRAIANIGNLLGIFADGAKDPIPGALRLNEVNAPVTLSMIGLGIQAEAAVFLNFLPEVREAVQRVQQTREAISSTYESEFLSLPSALRDVISQNTLQQVKSVNAEGRAYRVMRPEAEAAIAELEEAGLLTDGRNKHFNFHVDASQVELSFEVPGKANIFNINNEAELDALTAAQMGFTVRTQGERTRKLEDGTKEVIVLSPFAQKLVLLSLYQQQAQQAVKMRDTSRLVNLFKRLNPSFQQFDKIQEAIAELSSVDPDSGESAGLFKNSNKLFEPGQVWATLKEVVADLHEQSQRLFLERTGSMQPFMRLVGDLFPDKAELTSTTVSVVGLRMLRQRYNQAKTSELAARDTANFQAAPLVENFLGLSPNPATQRSMPQVLAFLRERYPTMKLLSFYRVRETKTKEAQVMTHDGKLLPARGEVYLEQINKGKTTGELAEALIDDHLTLLYADDPEVRLAANQLVYHELFRAGLGRKAGSAMDSLDQTILREVAVYVEEFASVLHNNHPSDTAPSTTLREVLGSEKESFEQVLDELLTQMVYQALQNAQKSRIATLGSFKLAITGKKEVDHEIVRASTGDTVLARKQQLTDALGYFFGVDKPVAPEDLAFFETFLHTRQPGDKISFKPALEPGVAVSTQVLDTLASTMGLHLNEVTEQFEFPFVVKTKGSKASGSKVFRLVSIDGESLSSRLTNEMQGTAEVVSLLGGLSAVYEAMPDGLGSQVVSPHGMTIGEAMRHHDVVTGKQVIVLPDPASFTVDPALVGGAQPKNQETKATEPVSVQPKGSKYMYSVFRNTAGQLQVVREDTGEPVASSSAIFKSVSQAYQQVYLERFLTGERLDESLVDNEHQYLELIAESSQNAQEVAQAWLMTEPAELTPLEQAIQGGLTKTTEESFVRWAPRLEKAELAKIGRSYFSADGIPLDVQEEMIAVGDNPVTRDDLVEFILAFPGGAQTARPEPGIQEQLAGRFESLTGVKLTAEFAQQLVEAHLDRPVSERTKGGQVLDQLLAAKIRQQLPGQLATLGVGRYVKYVSDGKVQDFVITGGDISTNTWQLKQVVGPTKTTKTLSGVKGSRLVATRYQGDVVRFLGEQFVVLPSNHVLPLASTRVLTPEVKNDLLAVTEGVRNLDLKNDYVARHFFETSASIYRYGDNAESFAQFKRKAVDSVRSMMGLAQNGKTLARTEIGEMLRCI